MLSASEKKDDVDMPPVFFLFFFSHSFDSHLTCEKCG